MKREIFLSWAHADQPAVERLMTKLRPELASLKDMTVTVWADSEVHIGDEWRREILGRLEECDYALALVSPQYLTRRFIVHEEIPRIVGSGAVTSVLPVGLKPVALDGSREWHGLDVRQMHLRRQPSGADRFFNQLRGSAAQDEFAATLATRIRQRVLRDLAAGATP